MKLDIQYFSKQFKVTYLKKEDLTKILPLCESNPLYYKHFPPMVSVQSILDDMEALPLNKKKEDKYYIGFWNEDSLIAMMDLINAYPDEESAWIGFFMVDQKYANKGVGTSIIEDVSNYLRIRYNYIRLAYVEENKQCAHFWKKNNFIYDENNCLLEEQAFYAEEKIYAYYYEYNNFIDILSNTEHVPIPFQP